MLVACTHARMHELTAAGAAANKQVAWEAVHAGWVGRVEQRITGIVDGGALNRALQARNLTTRNAAVACAVKVGDERR